MSGFGPHEIRIGEALARTEAHLRVACELYGAGRKPDALLQAARPITDVLPWLETEVRGAQSALRSFYSATAAVGSAIRSNVRPRALRRTLRSVGSARAELLSVAVGKTIEGPAFDASVAIALLEEAATRYRAAVEEESLGDYQTSYAVGDAGVDLLRDAGDRVAGLPGLLASADTVWPGIEPPERLARPDDVVTLVEEIAISAVEHLGAVRATWTLSDELHRIERLLGDVLGSYEQGLAPVSARLAASLFVRTYEPVRRDIAGVDPDAEARLTSLLGFELRRAVNDGASIEDIQAIVGEARELLTALRVRVTA